MNNSLLNFHSFEPYPSLYAPLYYGKLKCCLCDIAKLVTKHTFAKFTIKLQRHILF